MNVTPELVLSPGGTQSGMPGLVVPAESCAAQRWRVHFPLPGLRLSCWVQQNFQWPQKLQQSSPCSLRSVHLRLLLLAAPPFPVAMIPLSEPPPSPRRAL